MLIQINTYIVVMVLDQIPVQNFNYLMVAWVRMLLFFGVDLSSSGNIENEKKRYILGTILSIDPTQGLDDTTLTAETKYSINFSISNKDFCLRLHCNGRNGFFQPVHNVPRISPYGPVLVEASRTIIEPKQDVLGF